MGDEEDRDCKTANGVAKYENDSDAPLTSTPLRKYVSVVGEKKDNKWICGFGCRSEPYTGTYSRIRAHLIGLMPGQKSQGIVLCSKVKREQREKMRREEEEAKKVWGSGRKAPIPTIPSVPPLNAVAPANSDPKMLKKASADEVDGLIARCFYGCGLPFSLARAPFFLDMVRGINEAPRGYKPPSVEKLRTSLLDRECARVDEALMPIKQQWPTFGVSIVSEGWSNVKNQPLIHVLAMSAGRAVFLSAVDTSGNEKLGTDISEILLKAVESVGAPNVVQILTDDTSACKDAGEIIQTRHPHIFWSGCMAHTLSLLMKDIATSDHSSLQFIKDVYTKAKCILTYIKNHSMALFIYRMFPSLAMIQVKKTRLGHQYVVMDRILRLKKDLIDMVLSEEWKNIKTGISKSNLEEHAEVKKTILDDEFWTKLKIISAFTKPIWRMICVCDSQKAVIGEVYQRMGDMLGEIEVELSNANRADLIEVLRTLVLERWDKMSYPLHLLAYVLTPIYYSDSWLASKSPMGERRSKPHADPCVSQVYLDVVDSLVRDSDEASTVRRQLSDFVSDLGVFARPQAIQDRKTLSAIAWWNLYGAATPELYSLAVKVLSQSVNTSCTERAWSIYDHICSVATSHLKSDKAETLVYVHYNHRLLTHYREDYEKRYKNWDSYVDDDGLDVDLRALEEKEHRFLFEGWVNTENASNTAASSSSSSQTPALQVTATSQEKTQKEDVARGKKPRIS